jgi:hypothetical protein
MNDHGVALNHLANQAPFVNLTPQQKDRVWELIREIKSIFNQQAKKATRV